MIAIQMGCIKPAPCNPGCIGSITSDGCGFALLDGQCRSVIKLDEGLCPVERKDTARRYSALCYDRKEQCYWAADAGDCPVLYRLDACFQEVGRLKLTGVSLQHLCGMSCDPCHGTLWLLFPDALACVAKNSGACTYVPCRAHGQMYLGVLALCSGYLLSWLENGRQYIGVDCLGCGACTEVCLPREYVLKAMVLRKVCRTGRVDCFDYEVLLLLTKLGCCELYTMELFLSCCEGDRPPCPPPPPWPPTPPCCCGKYEIMHSVALEEAGIAHILNAEGEKLQKAVAQSESIEELLCINESVKRTITQITLLEGQLYSKLEVLTSCCGEQCPCHHDPKEPGHPGCC